MQHKYKNIPDKMPVLSGQNGHFLFYCDTKE